MVEIIKFININHEVHDFFKRVRSCFNEISLFSKIILILVTNASMDKIFIIILKVHIQISHSHFRNMFGEQNNIINLF